MRHEHRRDDGTSGTAATVAAVHNTRPSNRFPKAVFADLSVSEKKRVGAEKTKVMHGLDHTNVFCPCGIVGGGRDQRKRVVEMCDLRPVLSEQFPQLADRSAAPDRAPSEPKS